MRTENIENVISYLLRKNDDSDIDDRITKIKALDILEKLTDGNMYGNEYILVKMITNIYRVMISVDDENPEISIEDLKRLLSVRVKGIIFEEGFDLKKSIIQNDLAYNTNDPKDVEELINYFYTQALDSLDRIENIDITAMQVVCELQALQSTILEEIYRDKLIATSQAFNTIGLVQSIELDKEYDAKIMNITSIDLTNGLKTDELIIRSYEDRNRAKQLAKPPKPLFKMGIKPYDDRFSIMSDDIVVIVAEVNVGKTRLCIFLVYMALISGVNVTIYSTETQDSKVLNKLELMHFYMMFKYTKLPACVVTGRCSIEEEQKYKDIIKKFEYSSKDFWDNPKHGNVVIGDNFCYEDSMDEFLRQKRKNDSKLIVIDHLGDLKSSGKYVGGSRLTNTKEKLAYLMSCVKTCSKYENLGFILFSHPDGEKSKGINAEKMGTNTNIAANAAEVSGSASRMFYLSTDIELRAKDEVKINESKTREEAIYNQSVILKRMGSSNVHLYIEEEQRRDTYAEGVNEII